MRCVSSTDEKIAAVSAMKVVAVDSTSARAGDDALQDAKIAGAHPEMTDYVPDQKAGHNTGEKKRSSSDRPHSAPRVGSPVVHDAP